MLLWHTTLAVLGLAASVTAAPTPSNPCSRTFGGTQLEGRDIGDSCRFTVRYATAQRWSHSTVTKDLSGYSTTSLPPACPQEADSPVLASSPGQNEDCLFATIYAPKTALASTSTIQTPVFVWVHGGSYLAGAASAPGLDGTQLASRGDMIVVVLQYRLGVLGQLPPAFGDVAGDPNLALDDVINGLTTIKDSVRYLGGDAGKVTVAGQSSGASMVRALLAAPKAKGLFRAAILQSDPMVREINDRSALQSAPDREAYDKTHGTASAATTNQLRELFYSLPQVSGCSDLACLRSKPLSDILAAQGEFLQGAPSVVEGVPFVTPLRPTHGTPSLPADSPSLVSSYPSIPWSVPLLITTTKHEGGSVVSSIFPFPVPIDNKANGTYYGLLASLIDPQRAATLVQSREYAQPPRLTGRDAFREILEGLVTDGTWRCPSRAFGKRWADAGGKVWVGEFTSGKRYVSNEFGGLYCGGNRVCHEDDIFPTFHTGPNPSSAQLALEDEVTRRWSSFVHTLNPNPQDSLGSSRIALPPGSGNIDVSAPLPAGQKLPRHGLAETSGALSGNANNMVESGGSPAGEEAIEKRQNGLANWTQYRGDFGQVMTLGNAEKVDCPAGFWGDRVQYDWQIYG